MQDIIIFAFPDNEIMANDLANKLDIAIGSVEYREFPDGESYIRIHSDVTNKIVLILSTLDHPNHKMLPLMFMAETIKLLGARKIILVAPYLSYMRQDIAFHGGEAVTSRLFARYVSTWIDGLLTIEPHLHRIKHLEEIYTVQKLSVLHASQEIATWIQNHVDSPFLIGPDEESTEWIAETAALANAHFMVCQKERLGDNRVVITMKNDLPSHKTPIIVDDIISSGASMLTIMDLLDEGRCQKPICIGVHALFAHGVYEKLVQKGAINIVTCNTIPHASNQINLNELIARNISEIC